MAGAVAIDGRSKEAQLSPLALSPKNPSIGPGLVATSHSASVTGVSSSVGFKPA
jgi:hypothetical protein